MPTAETTPTRGFTTADLARRYRVSEDKIRQWIRDGLLRAINTADVMCAKPRYVVPPEALVEFERVRAAATPPKPQRRKRRSEAIDFYPD
ncbi:MAG TPA: helix-turn-helix domain-containing protein [Gemmata sp.]|jgi:hypothetical protein|nr:helix-turn-helix domain-containing protein [Gemmata sp.]